MSKQKSRGVIFLMLVVLAASAVPAKGQGMRLGGVLGGGAAFSSYSAITGEELGFFLAGDPSLWNDSESVAGGMFQIGATLELPLTQGVNVLTGLLLQGKELKYRYPKNTDTDDLDVSVTYTSLTIPLGLRGYAGWLLVGGGVYFGLTDEATFKVEYESASEEVDVSIENDIGLFLDLGLAIPVSESVNIELFARYEHQANKLYDDPDVITDIKQRSLSLNIGVSVGL